MKSAENELTSGGDVSENDGVNIQQNVTDKTVAKHLLKGEVTQEVEELRYRTYKVDRESKNYQYIGAGNAIKKEKKNDNGLSTGRFRFSQENKLVCADVASSLNLSGIPEKHTITVSYPAMERFNIEKFATMVDVKIDDAENIYTTIHFSEYPNRSKLTSKAFVNEMEKTYECVDKKDEYGLSRCYTFTSFLSLDFVTYKATNDQPDLFSFSFISPKIIRAEKKNGEYIFVYKWENYSCIDLTDKYRSESMERKYENKEKKELDINFDDISEIEDVSFP